MTKEDFHRENARDVVDHYGMKPYFLMLNEYGDNPNKKRNPKYGPTHREKNEELTGEK